MKYKSCLLSVAMVLLSQVAFALGQFEFTVLNPECCAGGAGLCVIMRTPEGRTYLYDTANGSPGDRELRNNGRDIIAPWLLAHGIKKIDGLVISHGHNDHIGGLHWMYGNFPIENLWDNGYILKGTRADDYNSEMGVYHKYRDEFAAAHPGNYRAVQQGDVLDFGNPDLKAEIVWPPKTFVDELENKNRMKGDSAFHHLENANAIAMQVVYGKVKFFIVGDIQEDYLEAEMAKKIPLEKWRSDICLMPSHGIHTVPLETELIRPKVAIAGIGDLPWMFGPAANARRLYEKVGAKVYISNVDGDITVTTDGETFNVTTNPCAIVRTREWATQPATIELGGWVKALDRYSKARGPRRWSEASVLERYQRAANDVKVYVAKGTKKFLEDAEAVQTASAADWLAAPARSLPSMMERPVMESEVATAWAELNLALLRATGNCKYAQALDELYRSMREHEVSADATALARTYAFSSGQHVIFFNLYTDWKCEGPLAISTPWSFSPVIEMKTDYPVGGKVTVKMRYSTAFLRGSVPLKFMVPSDRPNWTISGLDDLKYKAQITSDGYLTLSAVWPKNVEFTVEWK